MKGWRPYELRDIDDGAKRAEVCGAGVDKVRKGVKAIMLKGGPRFVAASDETKPVPPESFEMARRIDIRCGKVGLAGEAGYWDH